MFLKSIGFFLGFLVLTSLACSLTAGSDAHGDIRAARKPDAAAEGETLFPSMGCSSCHTPASQPAPNLSGLYGDQVILTSGTITADENYLRHSILDPKSQIVSGYEPIMPEYGDRLSEAQVEALVEYIRSIGE